MEKVDKKEIVKCLLLLLAIAICWRYLSGMQLDNSHVQFVYKEF